MSRRMTRIQRLGRAFSLIEVLIAILILALGLLGLGAVIPVVVREQRVASEATRGVIAANNARAYLLGRPDINRLVGVKSAGRPTAAGGVEDGMGFGRWLDEHGNWSTDYNWHILDDMYDRGTGLIRLGPDDIVFVVQIPVADRLWPHPSSGAEPLLIWDIVGRRIPLRDRGSPALPASATTQRTMELAIFVRRIDSAIRVPPGMRRAEMLLAPQSSPDFRMPVAMESGSGPTGNGDGDYYSLPLTLKATIPSSSRPNVIELDRDPKWVGGPSFQDWWIDRARLPGQKLVDNLGNIYTVVRPDPDDDDNVVVEPPVSAAALADFEQVLFTPQIPAAIDVFRVTIPRSPVKSPNGAGAGLHAWYGEVGEDPS